MNLAHNSPRIHYLFDMFLDCIRAQIIIEIMDDVVNWK